MTPQFWHELARDDVVEGKQVSFKRCLGNSFPSVRLKLIRRQTKKSAWGNIRTKDYLKDSCLYYIKAAILFKFTPLEHNGICF